MKKCPFCAEEIQDEAIVCRFCGRDVAVAAPVEPKPPIIATEPAPAVAPVRPARRVKAGGLLVLVGFALSFTGNGLTVLAWACGWLGIAFLLPGSRVIRYGLGFMLSCILILPGLSVNPLPKPVSTNSQRPASSPSQAAPPAGPARESDAAFAEKLKTEAADMKSFNSATWLQGGIDGVLLELAAFDHFEKLLEDAKSRTDPGVQAAATALRKSVADLQRKEFPKMRRAFAAAAGSMLWEHDITAAALGDRASSIELVGGMFAANRNIKEANAKLSSALTRLRFKRIQFRWYKGADEFQYYNYTPPADDVVQVVSEK